MFHHMRAAHRKAALRPDPLAGKLRLPGSPVLQILINFHFTILALEKYQ